MYRVRSSRGNASGKARPLTPQQRSFTAVCTETQGIPRFYNWSTTDYWTNPRNRYEFVLHLCKHLQPSVAEANPDLRWPALYRTSSSSITQAGGESMVANVHRNLLVAGLTTEVPHHAWQPWKFHKTPKKWWDDLVVGLRRKDPVSEAVAKDFLQTSDSTRDRRHLAAIAAAQTSSVKNCSTRGVADSGLFLQSEARHRFLQGLVRAPPSLASFYSISTFNVVDDQGATLLGLYGRSPSLAVVCEFPDHAWLPWKFKRSPQTWWHTLALNVRKQDPIALAATRQFLGELESRHQLNKPDDWLHFPLRKLKIADKKRMEKLGRTANVLRAVYELNTVPRGRSVPRSSVIRSPKQVQGSVNTSVSAFFPK